MFGRIDQRYRHIKRYRHIAEVFIRHGFGYVLEVLDLGHLLPLRHRVLKLEQKDYIRHDRGRRLRLALQELGPTFVKLGQMLSTRPDILPDDIISELEKLQDQVPPFAFEQVKEQITLELGLSPEERFKTFEEHPFAAASIGQVHNATLPDGTRVVVKVQRPGVARVIETDLEIIYGLAGLLDERFQPGLVSFVKVVDQFANVIRQELQYRREGYNIERFRRNFAGNEHVVIPRVFAEYSSQRVLTMERISGVRVSSIDDLDRLDVDRYTIARRGAEAFLKQILIDGFFHGDPHPGNILVLRGGRIGLVDFGMVGHLGPVAMHQLAELFVGVISRDTEKILAALEGIGVLGDEVDRDLLCLDIEDLIYRYWGKPLGEINLSAIMGDGLEVIRRHRIVIPVNFSLLAKALVTVESVGKSIAPDFNMLEVAQPFARKLLQQRYHPGHLFEDIRENTGSYITTLTQLPYKVTNALDRVNKGDLAIRFRHEGLEKLMTKLDIVSNRLAFGMIIAALIVGSSLIIQSEKGPQLWGIPTLGVIGFIFAGVMGIWLVISILRSGRV